MWFLLQYRQWNPHWVLHEFWNSQEYSYIDNICIYSTSEAEHIPQDWAILMHLIKHLRYMYPNPCSYRMLHTSLGCGHTGISRMQKVSEGYILLDNIIQGFILPSGVFRTHGTIPYSTTTTLVTRNLDLITNLSFHKANTWFEFWAKYIIFLLWYDLWFHHYDFALYMTTIWVVLWPFVFSLTSFSQADLDCLVWQSGQKLWPISLPLKV